MRLTRRIMAILLTLALASSLCPAAYAAIVEPFEDVPADAYYAPAVEWAVDTGVTDGIAPTLNSVRLPSTLTQLAFCAFHRCKSLERVSIPDGVSEISHTCFEFCDNLKEIYIPASVTKVAPFAFLSDSNLTTVYYGGSEEDWKKIDISTTENCNEYLLNANIIFNSTGLPSTSMENYP